MTEFSVDNLLGFLQQNGINPNMVIYIFFAGIVALFVVLYLTLKILRKPQETPPPPKPRAAPQPESASPAAPKPSAAAETSTPRPATADTQPTPAAPPAKPSVVAAAVRPQAAPPAPAPFGAHVPQDSVLRRHYLAEAQRMVEAVLGPSPADSVLRRHHRQLLQSRLEACLGDPARMDQLRAEYAACRAASVPKPIAAAVIAPQTTVVAPAPVAQSETKPQTTRIPEDSILRRHFLSHVRHLLEKSAPVRPTDSVLRRHYEQHIGSELRACLGDPARIDRLLTGYSARQA
jgi:hypothetical protein